MKKHPAIGIKSKAIKKIDRLRSPSQPMGIGVDLLMHPKQHPGHSALRPDRLVGIDQASISIEAMEESTRCIVDRAGEPERDQIVEQLAEMPLS
jgi:hypothetical protein